MKAKGGSLPLTLFSTCFPLKANGRHVRENVSEFSLIIHSTLHAGHLYSTSMKVNGYAIEKMQYY